MKTQYESECICDTKCRNYVNVKCKRFNKEPLLSAEEFLINKINHVHTSMAMQSYATYHTNWHLNNVKEVIINETDVYLGVTVQEIEQSITNAIENYIKKTN
jgi:hypothetical protein